MIGKVCKRMIDKARQELMKEFELRVDFVRYCDYEVTPENFVLICYWCDDINVVDMVLKLNKCWESTIIIMGKVLSYPKNTEVEFSSIGSMEVSSHLQ